MGFYEVHRRDQWSPSPPDPLSRARERGSLSGRSRVLPSPTHGRGAGGEGLAGRTELSLARSLLARSGGSSAAVDPAVQPGAPRIVQGNQASAPALRLF